MNGRNEKKSNSNGKLIAMAVLMLIYMPWLAIPAAILGAVGYAVYKTVIKPSQSGSFKTRERVPRNADFDDCPQPLFCFHKDKGEHHVKRGRERDPWDRPDTDISKYQRRR